MAKTAKKKPYKASPSTSRRTRGDVVREVSAATELKPRQVKDVFEALGSLMAADLGKKGCGEFKFNGLMKLKTVNKPATPARKAEPVHRRGDDVQGEAGQPQGPRPRAPQPERDDLDRRVGPPFLPGSDRLAPAELNDLEVSRGQGTEHRLN